MGHWWLMWATAPLAIPDLVWSGFRENIFGQLYLTALGLFILLNMFLMIYKVFTD
jgi:hypothetical protein